MLANQRHATTGRPPSPHHLRLTPSLHHPQELVAAEDATTEERCREEQVDGCAAQVHANAQLVAQLGTWPLLGLGKILFLLSPLRERPLVSTRQQHDMSCQYTRGVSCRRHSDPCIGHTFCHHPAKA